MGTRRRLITIDEAVPARGQHKSPCSDCPFARHSLPGWLGGETVDAWLAEAHSDNEIPCHTLSGAQCAGSAIYRRNVLKTPRDAGVLRLEADRELVFATPSEFKEHHESGPQGAAPSTRTGRGTPQASKRVSVMPKADVIAKNLALGSQKAKYEEKLTKLKTDNDAKLAKIAAAHDKKLKTAESKGVQAVNKMKGDVASVSILVDSLAAVNQEPSSSPTKDAAKKKKIEGLLAKIQKITDKYVVRIPVSE